MKVRYIIIIFIIVLSLGYLIGQFVPVNLLHPNITNKDITVNDYYTRLVSIIGAIATIFATLIALFKEDIKRLYEYASLNVAFKHSGIISEVLENETLGSSQSLSAKNMN